MIFCIKLISRNCFETYLLLADRKITTPVKTNLKERVATSDNDTAVEARSQIHITHVDAAGDRVGGAKHRAVGGTAHARRVKELLHNLHPLRAKLVVVAVWEVIWFLRKHDTHEKLYLHLCRQSS